MCLNMEVYLALLWFLLPWIAYRAVKAESRYVFIQLADNVTWHGLNNNTKIHQLIADSLELGLCFGPAIVSELDGTLLGHRR